MVWFASACWWCLLCLLNVLFACAYFVLCCRFGVGLIVVYCFVYLAVCFVLVDLVFLLFVFVFSCPFVFVCLVYLCFVCLFCF